MIALDELFWFTDTNLDDRLAAQSLLDDMATKTYEQLFPDDFVNRLTNEPQVPAEHSASPRPDDRPEATIDANDGAVQSLALHESSHAVVAGLLGLTVTGIELQRGMDGLLGRSWVRGLDEASPLHRALVLLAGPVAESRARAGPRGDVLAFLRGGAVEVAEARDLLGDGLGPALKHTRDLVCGSWPRIESLARRLLRGGALDGSGG